MGAMLVCFKNSQKKNASGNMHKYLVSWIFVRYPLDNDSISSFVFSSVSNIKLSTSPLSRLCPTSSSSSQFRTCFHLGTLFLIFLALAIIFLYLSYV